MTLFQNVEADPPKFYRSPMDVKRDRRFNVEEKLRILKAWPDTHELHGQALVAAVAIQADLSK